MIITLGYHCAITELNVYLNLKKETTPFEWFESRKLQYITNVIERLHKNPNEQIVFPSEQIKGVCLLNQDFLSAHYRETNFIDIFKRRYNRFLNYINESENIYFARYNIFNKFTEEDEIKLFIKSIKKINSSCNIYFLLIDTIKKHQDFTPIKINEENVIFKHDFFLLEYTQKGEPYLKNNKICSEKYRNMLMDLKYDVTDINYKRFTDKD